MIERYKLIMGDSAEVLKSVSSDSIDLTLTSPPYDTLRNYKGYTFAFNSIAQELYRTTKVGGVVVWVVGDTVIKGSETGTSLRQALYFMDCGFRLHDTMIYCKNGFRYPEKYRYYQHWEYMFVFSKGKPATVNLIADKRNKQAGTIRTTSNRQKDGTLNRHIVMPAIKEYGVRGNVWKYNIGYQKTTTDRDAYKHPALMPEELARDHILTWSNEGDIVLDPFAGACTTGKMAVANNRKFIGIDIAQEYLDIGKKRILSAIT